MKEILVADLMTQEPVTIKADTNLLQCAKILMQKKLGSLLIAEKKKLIGFISQKDILWAIVKKSEGDLKSIKAIDVSPKKIVTIRPSATIKEAMSKMKKTKFDRLPVVQENELVGIITTKDILNFKPEFYPELEEFARIREESDKLKRVEKSLGKSTMKEGICAECGNQDILRRMDGMLICSSCAESI